MKKGRMISNLCCPVLLAAVFMVQAGCKDKNPSGEISPRDTPVTANASIAAGSGQYPWKWKDGERASMYTTGASMNSNVPFTLSSVVPSGTSGTLSGTIRQTATGAHTFTVAYPYSESAAADQSKYVIKVPEVQNISTGGIDPSTYVLLGSPVAVNIPATGSVRLGAVDFSSPLAVAKLSFTTTRTFEPGEKVTAVRFVADSTDDIAGMAYCNLTDPTGGLDIFSYGGNAVDLFYPAGAEPEIAKTFDAWFTSFPFSVAPGGTYTITLMTDRQVLKGTVTAGQKTEFNAGVVTSLAVSINSDFKTDVSLMGKKWLELPDKISGAGQHGKAYYAVMKDNREGRNYSILFDYSSHLSLWVAFPMNKNVHLGNYPRPDPDPWVYDTEGDIPTAYQPNVISGTYGTYSVNNKARGHQIASADRNSGQGPNAQTFYMTNVTPQDAGLNSGAWESLEGAIRSVATSTTVSQDTLYIVTGPLLTSSQPKYLKDKSGKDCVVPDGYFKVILWSKYYASGRKYDSVGFMFENRSYSGTSFASQAVPVADVEKEAGFTFFGNLGLPASEMAAIKSTSSWSSFTNRGTNP